MALEFVVELHGVPQGHLHLPRPFARAMQAAKPPVLWLNAYGCSHDAMEVHTEYPKRRSMLLGRGWKAFARARSLEDGHILRFKLAEDNMLSVKYYERSGVRLGCCKESSSGAECPSSSDSDEENSSDSGALGTLGSRGGGAGRSTTPAAPTNTRPCRRGPLMPLPCPVELPYRSPHRRLVFEEVQSRALASSSPQVALSSAPILLRVVLVHEKPAWVAPGVVPLFVFLNFCPASMSLFERKCNRLE
ncbi:l-ascorbate oxidase-like protein [Hordeum vulgare]|nr:l-ascorbate oxidase-like protein [Hordeum vulgare]